MIRILLVDDQNLVQQGIKLLLERDPEIKVVGTVKDGRSAVTAIEKLSPDIVLLDIEMPGMDGITATKYITHLAPQTKVIILSSHEDKKYLTRALMAGAKSYILKDSLMRDLRQSVISVYNGYSQIESRLLAKIFDPSNVKLNKKKKLDTVTEEKKTTSTVAQNSIQTSEQTVFPDLALKISAPEQSKDSPQTIVNSASVVQHPSREDTELEPRSGNTVVSQVKSDLSSAGLTDFPPISAVDTTERKQPFPTTIAQSKLQLSSREQTAESPLVTSSDQNYLPRKKFPGLDRYRANLAKLWTAKQTHRQSLVNWYKAKSTQFESQVLPILKQWYQQGWLANAGLALLGLITVIIIHYVFF